MRYDVEPDVQRAGKTSNRTHSDQSYNAGCSFHSLALPIRTSQAETSCQISIDGGISRASVLQGVVATGNEAGQVEFLKLIVNYVKYVEEKIPLDP